MSYIRIGSLNHEEVTANAIRSALADSATVSSASASAGAGVVAEPDGAKTSAAASKKSAVSAQFKAVVNTSLGGNASPLRGALASAAAAAAGGDGRRSEGGTTLDGYCAVVLRPPLLMCATLPSLRQVGRRDSPPPRSHRRRS